MAVTAKQVYDQALVLMDEVIETGTITTDNPNYYNTKALSILTTLQTELLPLSVTPTVITDLSQELLVSDRVALLTLPYGLAAKMLISEGGSGDTLTMATFYNNRYDELKRKTPTSIQPITDVYGIVETEG
jgi:hypothetical protein